MELWNESFLPSMACSQLGSLTSAPAFASPSSTYADRGRVKSDGYSFFR